MRKKEEEIFILYTSLYIECAHFIRNENAFIYTLRTHTLSDTCEKKQLFCAFLFMRVTCFFYSFYFFLSFILYFSFFFFSIVICCECSHSLRHVCALDFYSYSYSSLDNYLCSYNSRHSSSFVFRWVLLVFSSSVNPTQQPHIRATHTHTTAFFTLTPCVNSLTRTLTLSL